jgi:hypothetical protein
MTAPAERAAAPSSHLDRLAAVSRFFRQDPARILVVASSLRAPERVIESTVLGMSMGRTIPAGSRIRIELGEQRRHPPGEVVAFVAGPHIVVHRLLRRVRRRGRGYLLTQGDAALVLDPPIAEDRVLGPVTAVLRAHGWTPTGPPPDFVASTRLLRWLLAVAAQSLLHVHPRAAAIFITSLHGTVAVFRRGVRRMPPERSGRVPSEIA